MSGDVFEVLDELAARGRRLRRSLPGDYRWVSAGAPVTDLLVCLHYLSLPNTPASDEEGESKEAAA